MLKKVVFTMFVFIFIFSQAVDANAAKVDIDNSTIESLLRNKDFVNKTINDILYTSSSQVFSEKELKEMRLNKIKKDSEMSIPGLYEKLREKNTTIEKVIDDIFKEDLNKYFSKEEVEKMKKTRAEKDKYFESIITKKYDYKSVLPDDIKERINLATDWGVANAYLAYFKIVGYRLSETLLARSMYNKDDSDYLVPNGLKDFLYNTVAYRGLCNRNKYNVYGKVYHGSFKNKFNRDETDAYYAIHDFDATVTNNRIKITDRYDFKESKKYSGPVSQAVNSMVNLQNKGAITNYKIIIPLVRK